MRRAVLSVVLVAAAVVLQLTMVNRLPLPGAGAPDLVLLTIVALGLCGSPAAGAVTGFCAGLCLDLAPPGSYLVGEYALVLCLVGYLCGRLRGGLGQSALLTILTAMAVAVAGEALFALVGLAVSDPQVTWPAIRHVLPSTAIYDAAISPFVLYLVVRAAAWADGLGREGSAGGHPADGSALLSRAHVAGGALPVPAMAGATMLGGAGLLGGAGWLAGPVGSRAQRAARGKAVHVPRTPRLRQAAARPGDGWVGGGPRGGLTASQPPRPARPGRAPRLRPGSGSPGSAIARPSRPPQRAPANLRIGARSRRDANIGRVLGARLGAQAGPGPPGRGRSGPPGSAFRGTRPAAARPAARVRPAALGRGAFSGRGPLSRGPLSRGPLSLGAASNSPRFRPDPRLRGGSSSGAAKQRALPSRRVNLRLGSMRRHDGVLGGGMLGGAGARRLAARPVSLRLGSGRRGDGALGSVLGASGFLARQRLGVPRRAVPRFRSGPGIGAQPALRRRTSLRAGKRVRFTSAGSSSFLATWTGGRLGGRSTVWRIGSKRTGGL